MVLMHIYVYHDECTMELVRADGSRNLFDIRVIFGEADWALVMCHIDFFEPAQVIISERISL